MTVANQLVINSLMQKEEKATICTKVGDVEMSNFDLLSNFDILLKYI